MPAGLFAVCPVLFSFFAIFLIGAAGEEAGWMMFVVDSMRQPGILTTGI